MREIISISLPTATTEKLKMLSKQRGHKSTSGYIQHLIEMDTDVISEKELLQSIKQARGDYKKGQTVTAISMADLL